MQFLQLEGYILVTDDQYPVVKLTEKSKEAFENTPIRMKAAKEKEHKKSSLGQDKKQKKDGITLLETDYPLFEKLRKLRMEIAKAEHVPPYIVFSDKSLKDMSAKKPKNKKEFLEVSGVGENKCEKYGEKFLTVILEE